MSWASRRPDLRAACRSNEDEEFLAASGISRGRESIRGETTRSRPLHASSSASFRASVQMRSNMRAVSRPVFVFCRLG